MAPASCVTLGHWGLGAVALMLTVPFLLPFHGYPIPSFYNEWTAFALGLVALAALLRSAAWKPLAVPAIALIPIAFCALILVQSAGGMVPYSGQATVATQYLIWAAALMVLGAALRREFGAPRLVTVIAWSLVTGAALNSVAALLQHYSDPAQLTEWVTRKTDPAVYGNLAQRNHLACHLTLGLASLAYLYGRGAVRHAAAACGGALLLIVLALAASRSTFIYLVVLCVLAAFVFRARRDPDSRRILLFVLVCVPGFVLANWLVTLDIMKPSFGAATAAMVRIFDTAGGIGERVEVWREAWWTFLRSPWIGTGYGTFAWHHYIYHVQFDAPLTRGQNFNHAHNIVLHVLAEFGAAGAGVLAAAAVMLAREARRAALDSAAFVLWGIVSVLALYSLLEYPLWYSYFLGPASLALGAATGGSFEFRAARVGRAVAALILVGGGAVLASAAVNYRDFEQLFFVHGDRERPEHSDVRRFAATLQRLYREPLLVPYVELAAAYGTGLGASGLAQQRELVERAVRFAPYGPAVYRRVALAALAGDADSMRRDFMAAYKVYPGQLPAFVAELRKAQDANPARLGPLLELATANFRGRPKAPGAQR